jgi:hypothetical protein
MTDDEMYRQGVIELLGVLAYSELSASQRLAEDAAMAPTLASRVELGRMARAEFAHLEALIAHLEGLGENPYTVMETFAPMVEKFQKRTRPRDWLEGLVKAYVGDGLAADFYREISTFLDDATQELIQDVCGGTGHSDFVIEEVRHAVEVDSRVGGRLALWGRRLMGEALSQAQRVVAERDALTGVLMGEGESSIDLAEVGRLFTRITEAHSQRMAALGLDA